MPNFTLAGADGPEAPCHNSTPWRPAAQQDVSAHMRYVVDTNIFNRLADGVISRNDLPANAEFIATHIQIDEINRTDDRERRARLFLVFAESRPMIVPTESGVWGTSRWGQFKWGAGSGFTSIKSSLDSVFAGAVQRCNRTME